MSLSPLVAPLIVAAIVWRRAMRAQKPKTVRTTRLWIFPGLLAFVTLMSLWSEGFPGILVSLAFLAAAFAGAAIGWFRVHTLEFSLDAESGKVSERSTQLAELLIIGLIGLRYVADYAIKAFGLAATANVVHATDATLLFSTAMLVARSVHTWIKERSLIDAHRRTVLPATDPAPSSVSSGQSTSGS